MPTVTRPPAAAAVADRLVDEVEMVPMLWNARRHRLEEMVGGGAVATSTGVGDYANEGGPVQAKGHG